MHRRVVLLLALVACEASAPPADTPVAWVYAPQPTVWPLGAVHGRIGRSQAPQMAPIAGIAGDVKFPLRLATPWAVPGEGPARAVLYGLEGVKPAIEVVDVDQGRVLWRDTTTCAGPIVGVTDQAIVCADAAGTRGVTLDGKKAWRSEAPYIAMTEDRVVVGPTGQALILDATDGEELSTVKLPAGVIAETIIASCGDAGRELFATSQDGKLVRIADAKGGAAIAWSVPIGAIEDIDGCDGDSILIKTPGANGASLISIARATGVQTGRVDGVRGHWPARSGDSLEIATAVGVQSWGRDLATPGEATSLPPLGELLARRGDRRLVRATPLTAALLDRSGVRAYVPFAQMGAVLGDQAILGSSWVGSQAESVRRIGLPASYGRALRVTVRTGGVAVPAELRDLPEVKPADLAAAIAKPDSAKHSIGPIALDPTAPSTLYAVTFEQATDDSKPAGIAAIDLTARAWRWHRLDACGPGTPIAIAVASDVIVCGTRGPQPGSGLVRATSRDGAPRWEWEGDSLDALQAAGDIVLVHVADRLVILDAVTGRARAHITSDDGALVRAAPIRIDDAITLVITYERGRVIARLPGIAMVPLWSIAIDGVVRALSPSHGGVLVELEDGDAARIDARTGSSVALPGLGLSWRATGDLVTGTTFGGPIPGPPRPPAPPPLRRRTAQGKQPPPPELDPERPRLWTPIQPPPPLGDSWQYTLYELTGGLRARNDYALLGQIAASEARGPAGSPLVVAYGSLREVLVLDPRTGDPLRRVSLPEDAPAGVTFSTVVDGTPVAGTVLASPLRVVLF